MKNSYSEVLYFEFSIDRYIVTNVVHGSITTEIAQTNSTIDCGFECSLLYTLMAKPKNR